MSTTTEATTVTVRVAPTFYDDHVDRDLPSGVEVGRNKTYVIVELDAEGYDDLLDDARHYSNARDFDGDFASLCASARAVVRTLSKVERPAGPSPAEIAAAQVERVRAAGERLANATRDHYPYRYECPRGHRWNVIRDEAGKLTRHSPSPSCCPSCGYIEEEDKAGPIIDHGHEVDGMRRA